MKHPIFFALVNLLLVLAACNNSNNKNFSDLGKDKDFKAAHDNPKAVENYTFKGKQLTYATKDGKDAGAYIVKSNVASDKYLFVIHEWWGLNDHIKKEADRFAKELPGVNVLALDLYDGQVATKREDAAKFMKAATEDRANAIIRGAIDYSGNSAEIGTIGWCFGGGWSHKASILLGDQGIGCVIYYGMPELNAEKLVPLKADVLGVFAAKEKWISPEIVKKFEQVMAAVGKKLTVHSFDADHAFANPSSERYNSESATKANALSLAFLKEKFGL